MKAVQYTECWYAAFLALGACFVGVPTGIYSYRTFTDGGHDAILGWPFAIAALLLWSWAAWCCGWELRRLRTHRNDPNLSETAPLVLFCFGIIALLLALGIVVTL